MSRPGPPVVLGISFTALAAGMFSIVSFGTLAPELQTGLGLSRAAIGLLASLIFVGALLSSRPAGRLTDSTGPGGVLGLALCGLAGAMALAAASPAAAPFMAAAFIAGLAYGGVNPATNVIVAGQLARRLGFFLSVKQSGVPVGGLVAGILLPPVALAFGWRVALLVPVLVCLAVAAATPLLRGAAVLAASEDGPDRPWRRADQFALGFFGFAMSGTQWAFLSYLTLYLTEEIEFSLYPAGLALALAQGFGAGGRLAWGWLSDREGRRRLAMRWRVPMIGDESCISLSHVARSLDDGAIRTVSVKTARTGFTESRRILGHCLARAIPVVVGSQYEGAVGVLATAAFAPAFAATAGRAAEVMSYTDLGDDLLAEPIVIRDGRLVPPAAPGLGIEIDEEKLAHYRLHERGALAPV